MGLSGVCSPQRTRCPSPGPSIAQGGDKAEPGQGKENLGEVAKSALGWAIGTPAETAPAGARKQGSGSGVLPIQRLLCGILLSPAFTPAPHGTPYKVT